MRPFVSILIPAYNAQEWIAETITSALAQTWTHTEIVIVDDGSTDRTVEIARRFTSPKIRIQQQDHRGASAARNHAYALSRGDYIQWLDADDLLASEKIERQLACAQKSASDRILFSCSWAKFMYRRSRAQFVPTALWQDLTPVEWLLLKMEQNIYMQTATWLVPRRLADAAGPWDTRLLSDDDGEYFTRVLLKSDQLAFVPGARVYQRTAIGQSLSYVGRSETKLEAQLLSIELNIAYLRSVEDSPRTRRAGLRYLQTSLGPFHVQRPELVQRAQRLATDLGGQVELPTFQGKYRWIERLFGQQTARQAQLVLPRARWSLLRRWDKLAGFVEAHVVRGSLP